MKCTSTRFGSFDVPTDSLVTFPSGLLGFPEQQRYVILDHDTEAPIKWLQSMDEPELAFVILDPTVFHPNYHIEVSADALTEIRAQQGEELALAVILTIPSNDPSRITANLRGPLLISHKTKLGKQLVLSEEFPTRHAVFPVSSPQSSEITPAPVPAQCQG